MLTKRTMLAAATASLVASFGRADAGNETLRIGVPTPLTGPYGDVGNQAKRAIIFAMDEANAAGGVDGRSVEVRFLDTEGKADQARQQGEKLALGGHNILIATQTSGESLAIAPLLARWNAIYVSTISKANAITGQSCNARMFRANHPDYSDAAVVKPWLATRNEVKWASIAADQAWGRDSGASFVAAAKADHKEIVSENYPPLGSNDYAPYIQKIKESGAEGLWVALSGRDAITFGTQAHQFGLLDRMVVAGVSFVTDNTVTAMGAFSAGIWGVINYSSTLDLPENRRFVAAWEKRYPGTTPSNFEGETYIGMQVIFQSVKKAGSIAPLDLCAVMAGATFDTIVGPALMRKEDHQLVVPNYFGQVGTADGALKPVIKLSVPAEIAMPGPQASCKLTA